MKRVFLLVNTHAEYDFGGYVEKYLRGVLVDVGTTMPPDPSHYFMVVPWNYRKKIDIGNQRNVYVFHGSDLPQGKGFAPIYYTFAQRKPHYTLTGIRVNDEIDGGDIILKARFSMKSDYTADYVRQWDNEIMIKLVAVLCEQYDDLEVLGVKQTPDANFNKRRRPEDNEINLGMKFEDIVLHLKACEQQTPVYFIHEGEKFIIKLFPARPPSFPSVEITFHETGGKGSVPAGRDGGAPVCRTMMWNRDGQ